MRTPQNLWRAALSILILPMLSASADFKFPTVAPEDVAWRDVPNTKGLQTAIISGDPSKPGVYVQRVKFPPGTMTRPHFHPEDRYAVVLKGTWWVGTGDEFAPDKTVPNKAGTFMKHPAGEHHYDGAKDEEVIVQITGVGPSATTLLHPELGLTGSSLDR